MAQGLCGRCLGSRRAQTCHTCTIRSYSSSAAVSSCARCPACGTGPALRGCGRGLGVASVTAEGLAVSLGSAHLGKGCVPGRKQGSATAELGLGRGMGTGTPRHCVTQPPAPPAVAAVLTSRLAIRAACTCICSRSPWPSVRSRWFCQGGNGAGVPHSTAPLGQPPVPGSPPPADPWPVSTGSAAPSPGEGMAMRGHRVTPDVTPGGSSV